MNGQLEKPVQKDKCCWSPQQATWHHDLHGWLRYKGPVWLGGSQSSRVEGLYTKTEGSTQLAKGGGWNGRPDWHTAMHSLRLQDFCGSTAVRTLESVGMNRQTDWQAQQIAHLVCRGAWRLEELSEHGQARASQLWSPEGKRSGERKQPTFHPPRLGMLFSTRQTLAISRARLGRLLRDGAECIWTFPSATMPSWAESETVNQEENKPWHSHYCSCCHSSPYTPHTSYTPLTMITILFSLPHSCKYW